MSRTRVLCPSCCIASNDKSTRSRFARTTRIAVRIFSFFVCSVSLLAMLNKRRSAGVCDSMRDRRRSLILPGMKSARSLESLSHHSARFSSFPSSTQDFHARMNYQKGKFVLLDVRLAQRNSRSSSLIAHLDSRLRCVLSSSLSHHFSSVARSVRQNVCNSGFSKVTYVKRESRPVRHASPNRSASPDYPK